MSELQNKAKDRNFLKMRLSGCYYLFKDKNVTPEEQLIMDSISFKIRQLLDGFKDNSIKLGFKAYDRCYYCKRKAIGEYQFNGKTMYLCNKHSDTMI